MAERSPQRRLAAELLMVAGFGLVLGLFGPFGTWAMPTPLRLAYWMVFSLVGFGVFRPLVTVGRWMADFLAVSPYVGIGLALLIAALPMTLIVALLLNGFQLRQAFYTPGLGLLYFQVWLIGFLVNGFFMLVYARHDRTKAAPHPSTVPPPSSESPAPVVPQPMSPTLADRLPPGFGAVIALQGEDHYVRVHSAAGSTLVLMRLRDAVVLAAEAGGLEVHRSWWVASAGVASVQRNGRTATLTLVNGAVVPVARDAMPRLRAAGWLG